MKKKKQSFAGALSRLDKNTRLRIYPNCFRRVREANCGASNDWYEAFYGSQESLFDRRLDDCMRPHLVSFLVRRCCRGDNGEAEADWAELRIGE
jgi:hypothetical protein